MCIRRKKLSSLVYNNSSEVNEAQYKKSDVLNEIFHLH